MVCLRSYDNKVLFKYQAQAPFGKERKGKEEYLYSAFLHQGTHKALRHGSHSFTCKQHHACLSFVAFTRCHHHSNWGSRHPIAAHYSFIDHKRMKGWVGLVGLTYSRWLTHISGHPSATSRAQDSESTSAKDQCYTAGLRHQPCMPCNARYGHRITIPQKGWILPGLWATRHFSDIPSRPILGPIATHEGGCDP